MQTATAFATSWRFLVARMKRRATTIHLRQTQDTVPSHRFLGLRWKFIAPHLHCIPCEHFCGRLQRAQRRRCRCGSHCGSIRPSFFAQNNEFCYDDDMDVAIAFAGEVRLDGDCENNYVLIRSWTATDCAGQTRTREQILNV